MTPSVSEAPIRTGEGLSASDFRVDEIHELRRGLLREPVVVESAPKNWEDVQAKQSLGGQSRRQATLGVLLANLVDVDFDTTARFLGVSEKKLTQLMHGGETIAASHADRWDELAQALEVLHLVLDRAATAQWLRTPIPRRQGRTPLQLAEKGKHRELLDTCRSYLNLEFT